MKGISRKAKKPRIRGRVRNCAALSRPAAVSPAEEVGCPGAPGVHAHGGVQPVRARQGQDQEQQGTGQEHHGAQRDDGNYANGRNHARALAVGGFLAFCEFAVFG